eukprot:1011430-Pyramimonas_sp.AAC.1
MLRIREADAHRRRPHRSEQAAGSASATEEVAQTAPSSEHLPKPTASSEKREQPLKAEPLNAKSTDTTAARG